MATWTKKSVGRRALAVFETKLPPIPETKLDAYALELKRSRTHVRVWRALALVSWLAYVFA